VVYSTSNIIHITTSVSRVLNVLCIMFKNIASFIITLFHSMLYSHVENTCMAALVHRTSLTPPRFIEVTVPCHESERSCFLCVGVVDPLSVILILLDFRTVPTMY
jgi:hypothetical protein